MSEIKVTQADRDCEEKIIKAMVSSSFLPGCFAAAHRQAAMIEGARRMRDAALVAVRGTNGDLCKTAKTSYRIALEAIHALDPASIVETDQ